MLQASIGENPPRVVLKSLQSRIFPFSHFPGLSGPLYEDVCTTLSTIVINPPLQRENLANLFTVFWPAAKSACILQTPAISQVLSCQPTFWNRCNICILRLQTKTSNNNQFTILMTGQCSELLCATPLSKKTALPVALMYIGDLTMRYRIPNFLCYR